mmetsp:Transcript_18162/g.27949  ORF Transcript_18162/g.27949 Transcript_18162/m.27949 type:complete len:83 (+) Transcript_18162:11067-11315(+)
MKFMFRKPEGEMTAQDREKEKDIKMMFSKMEFEPAQRVKKLIKTRNRNKRKQGISATVAQKKGGTGLKPIMEEVKEEDNGLN